MKAQFQVKLIEVSPVLWRQCYEQPEISSGNLHASPFDLILLCHLAENIYVSFYKPQVIDL